MPAAPEPAETRAIPLGDRPDGAPATAPASPAAGREASPSAPPPLREPDDPNPSVRTWYLPAQTPSAPSAAASAAATASSPAATPVDEERPAGARPTPIGSASSESPASAAATSGAPASAAPTTDLRALDLGDLRRRGTDGARAAAHSTSGDGADAPATDGVSVLFGDLDPDPITGAVPLPGPATAAAGLLRRITGRDGEDQSPDGDAAPPDDHETDPADEPSGAPGADEVPKSGLGGLLRRFADRDRSAAPEAPAGSDAADDHSGAPAPIDDDVADFDPAPELGRADRGEPTPSIADLAGDASPATADADADALDGPGEPAAATRVFAIPAPDADADASPAAIPSRDHAVEEAAEVGDGASGSPHATATAHDDDTGSPASSGPVTSPASAGPLPTVAADGAPRFALAPSGEPQSGQSTVLEKIAFGASIVIAPVGLAANVVLAALSTRRRGWTHRLTSAGIAVGVAMTIVSAGLLALGDSAAQDAIEHRSLQAQSGAFCHLIATEPVGAEQKDFGWPAAQSSIPESVAAAQAFIDRWDAVAAVAPTGIRAQVTQIAGMGRELLTQIQETQTADDATAQQRLSALRDQSDVPGWISEYCD